jgi:hypothetical protein
MNQEARIAYFEKKKKETPYSHKDIYYQGTKQKLPVYKIDLEWLVYNRWNGRIASLVKTYENEYGVELEASDPKCIEIIENFLWDSNKSANDATFTSLDEQGQNEYGIITKDGVIIDGNRRAMILKEVAKARKEKPVYFLGVVLDEKLADNRKEIMRLETTYQMGEDAKVDYNPIEKYLKCKDMIDEGFDSDEIGKAMGEDKKVIEEYLEIMNLMDEYLDELGYKGIYTRLDKTEDLFINLNKVYRKWKNTSGKVQWNFKQSDLDAFKLISFDHIRYVYNSPKGIQAKEVREFLTRNSEESFFAHHDIWQDFSNRHAKKVDVITNNEKTVDELRAESPTRELSSLLKSRDTAWATQVDSCIKENFGITKEALENLQNKSKPLVLLRSALGKLQAIDVTSLSFLSDTNVFKIVDDIRKTADEYKKIIITHQKHQ